MTNIFLAGKIEDGVNILKSHIVLQKIGAFVAEVILNIFIREDNKLESQLLSQIDFTIIKASEKFYYNFQNRNL